MLAENLSPSSPRGDALSLASSALLSHFSVSALRSSSRLRGPPPDHRISGRVQIYWQS